MANIIDDLLINLNINADGFRQGAADADRSLNELRDNANRTSGDMERHGDRAAAFYSKIRREALLMLSVFTGGKGLVNFTSDTVKTAVSLDRVGNSLGMTANRLKAFEDVSKRAGGTGSAMVAQMQREAYNATQMMLGMVPIELSGRFAQFGGRIRRGMTPEELFAEKQRVIKSVYEGTAPNMPKGVDSRVFAAQLAEELGISADAFQDMRSAAFDYLGAVDQMQRKNPFGEADTARLKEVNSWWFDITQKMDFFSKNVLMEAVDGLGKLNTGFELPNRKNIHDAVVSTVEALNTFIPLIKEAKQSAIDFTSETLFPARQGAIDFLSENVFPLPEKAKEAVLGAHGKAVSATSSGIESVMNARESAINWTSDKIDSLANLVGTAESGSKGYNAYNRGTRGGKILAARHERDLESMSVADIMADQARNRDDPNRLFAVGRYQVIPDTLRAAVSSLGIDPKTKFDKETQDRIFNDYLIKVKRPQIGAYISGKSNDANAAANALAAEWASFADPATGRSKYGSGNKASVTLGQSIDALQQARGAHTKPVGAMLGKGAQQAVGKSLNIGTQIFNIQANDTQGIMKEIKDKASFNDKLLGHFNSAVAQ